MVNKEKKRKYSITHDYVREMRERRAARNAYEEKGSRMQWPMHITEKASERARSFSFSVRRMTFQTRTRGTNCVYGSRPIRSEERLEVALRFRSKTMAEKTSSDA